MFRLLVGPYLWTPSTSQLYPWSSIAHLGDNTSMSLYTLVTMYVNTSWIQLEINWNAVLSESLVFCRKLKLWSEINQYCSGNLFFFKPFYFYSKGHDERNKSTVHTNLKATHCISQWVTHNTLIWCQLLMWINIKIHTVFGQKYADIDLCVPPNLMFFFILRALTCHKNNLTISSCLTVDHVWSSVKLSL